MRRLVLAASIGVVDGVAAEDPLPLGPFGGSLQAVNPDPTDPTCCRWCRRPSPDYCCC